MYCLQEVVGAVGDVSEGDAHTAVWQWMQLMLQGQMSVDVTVTGANSGGLVVQYEQLRGFIPASHLGRVSSMLALVAAAAAAPNCLQSMCSTCTLRVQKHAALLLYTCCGQHSGMWRAAQQAAESSPCERCFTLLVMADSARMHMHPRCAFCPCS